MQSGLRHPAAPGPGRRVFRLPAAPLIWRSSSCWWMPCRQAGWYPARTSRRLIHKLEKLCSNYEGSQLQRQVYVEGRPKTDSKSLLYSIDALHEAINNGKMVEFLLQKGRQPRERRKGPSARGSWRGRTAATTSLPLPDEKGPGAPLPGGPDEPGCRVLDAPRRGRAVSAPLTCPPTCASTLECSAAPEHRVTLRCTADLEAVPCGSALARRRCSARRRMAASTLMCPSASATSSMAGSAALAAR